MDDQKDSIDNNSGHEHKDSINTVPIENAKSMTMKEVSSGPLGVAKVAINIWSRPPETRQRQPPTPTKTIHIRLISIVVSHYCEKVRWGLDILESDTSTPYYYTEDAHPPGLHAYEALRASNGEASITPMAVVSNGKVSNNGVEESTPGIMCESSEILRRFIPSLYPPDIVEQVHAKELEFGRRLGPAVRCYAYYNYLSDVYRYGPALKTICADTNKVSWIESILFQAMLPRGLGDGIKKGLQITREASDASLKEIKAVFEETSRHLDATGGEYLFDEPNTSGKLYGFTAADLTFSALAYPFVMPSEMAEFLSPADLNPDCLNKLSDELRQTTAGQYVLRMYKKHRPVDSGDVRRRVVMKNVNRDRSFRDWLSGR